MDFLKQKNVRKPTRRAMATGTCLLMGSGLPAAAHHRMRDAHAPHFQRNSVCSTRCAHSGALERNSTIFIAQKLEIRAAAIANLQLSGIFPVDIYR
jgi:hypothetical protein